ncbi:MAG: DUF559 domain-containing protein [Candidatus Aenigmatarchaeota archaeon]
MRYQLLKLTKRKSTKAERIFGELLKNNRIPFRAKVKINGREVDFLVGKYAIDIDCHQQNPEKNIMLFNSGFIPIHFSNQEIKNNKEAIIKWLLKIYGRN